MRAAAVALAAVSLYYLSFLFTFPVLAAMAIAAFLIALKKYPWPRSHFVALLLVGGITSKSTGSTASSSAVPIGSTRRRATDFLLQHHIKGKIFNTYGQGGYLIWRLWPDQQVFLDGRALNESVHQDAEPDRDRCRGTTGGKSGEQLLKDYGIDVIVMDAFDSVSGQAFYLPAAWQIRARRNGSWYFRTITTSSICEIRRPASRRCNPSTLW